MKGKILYLLLWIATVYLGILYYSQALLGLAVLEILVPVVSGILLWVTAKNATARPYIPIGVAEKNQQVNIGTEVEVKRRIPIPRIRVKLAVKNQFYNQEQQAVLWGMAEGKSKVRLTAALSSQHCGPIMVQLQEVKIFDIFCLFSRKIPVRGKEMLAVLPEYYMASVVLREDMRDFLAESEEYDKSKPGDDPSEVFQIREYRGGDRMQSIHWKLSARTDDLMVKEYSLPTGNPVVFFWDMQYVPEEDVGYLDEYIEAALAISQGLLEVGCEHYAAWFDKNRQDMDRIAVKEAEDLYLLTERIFSSGPYTEEVLMEELYREKYRGETWHTQLMLNLKKELWKNGELELELNGQARDILENEIIL